VLELLENLIWLAKTKAGIGSFYRSQNEMIGDYAAPGRSINRFSLGSKGRHRPNGWKYPGFNSFGRAQDGDHDRPRAQRFISNRRNRL
jgi:hypothetical protein